MATPLAQDADFTRLIKLYEGFIHDCAQLQERLRALVPTSNTQDIQELKSGIGYLTRIETDCNRLIASFHELAASSDPSRKAAKAQVKSLAEEQLRRWTGIIARIQEVIGLSEADYH